MLKLLFAATALSIATPIVAFGQDVPPTVRVHVADLDLGTEAGRHTMDRRITRAVAKVCPVDWNADLSRRLPVAKCRSTAFASVAGQRDNALTARKSLADAGAR